VRHLLVSYHTCPLEEPGTGLAGGMNVFLRGLLAGLSARGIETDVLTRGTGDEVVATRPWPGVRVLHVPCGWRDPPSRESAYECLPRFVERSRGLLAGPGEPFRVLSAHYWMSGVAARALVPRPLPFVLVYHTVEARKAGSPPAAAGWLGGIRRAAEEELSREADRVVCFTGEDLAETRRIFPGISGKGEVIAPGVDESFRRPPPREAARRALGLPPEAFLFLLAARPDPGKNVDFALDAFAASREVPGGRALLLVAGQEPPPGGSPEGVLHAGPIPHAAMPSLLAAADAVLCPSAYESFGFVPLEAMAAGVPVVAPDSGHWGRMIRAYGGGLAYPAGDGSALAAAMARLRGDAPLRRRMGEEGKRIAAAFKWETCTDSWARLLSCAATRGSRRGAPRARAAPRRRPAARRGAS
jgi:D-inositol-3-phosphate glycosyltransferase